MIKIILPLSFLILSFFSANAQTTTNNSVFIVLSSDLLDANLYYAQSLDITCNQNTTISGKITSDTSVRIYPKLGNSIVISPLLSSSFQTANTGDPTTVIKSKGTGTGSTPPVITVYPNPVQTTLNFNIPNSTATAYNIFDSSGILKKSLTFAPTNTGAINVSDLTNGVYILTVDLNNTQTLSIQFIKN